MYDTVHNRMQTYLDNSCDKLQTWLFHRKTGADERLAQLNFSIREENGKKVEEIHKRLFGDNRKFHDRILENLSAKKHMVVMGESGLGKTWLLAGAFCEFAGRFKETGIFSVYLELKGFSLTTTLTPDQQERYEKARNEGDQVIVEIFEKMTRVPPDKKLKDIFQARFALEPERLKSTPTILFIDGLNEIPRAEQQVLFPALYSVFPEALFVFNGQPQAINSIEEINRHKEIEAEGNEAAENEALKDRFWDFFSIVPVSEDRLEDYIRVWVDGSSRADFADLKAYFNSLSPAVRQIPRYIEMLCRIYRETPQDLPNRLGLIADRVISQTLRLYAERHGISEHHQENFIQTQKLILGGLAIYEMLSAAPLSWTATEAEAEWNAWNWLETFEQAKVLPTGWLDPFSKLKESGPWGYSPTAIVKFDHDTTRDYAAANLIFYLLTVWSHRNDDLREFLKLMLIFHPEMGKALALVLDLVAEDKSQDALKIDRNWNKVSSNEFNAYACQHPQIMQWLLIRLADKGDSVRELSVNALSGAVDFPEVSAALIERLDDKFEFVRKAAVGALASTVNVPEVRAALIQRLGDEYHWVRERSVNALAGVVDAPAVCAALIERLDDKFEFVRKAAVGALASTVNVPEVQAALIQRFGDEDHYTREAAVKALAAAVNVPEVRATLIDCLADKDRWVRNSTVNALAGAVNVPEVRAALIQRFGDEDEDYWVRSSALHALTSVANIPEVRAVLILRLWDKDSLIRYEMETFLTSASFLNAARPSLIERLADKNKFIREFAAKLLASGVNDSTIQEIIGRLEDERWYVRGAVVKVLAGAGNVPEVRAGLVKRLTDENEDVRKQAVYALRTEISDPEVRAVLIERLRDDNWMTRLEMVRFVRHELSDPAVRTALIERLEDNTKNVRKAATNILAPAVDDPEVCAALINRLGDDNNEVKYSAACILAGVVNATVNRKIIDSVIRESLKEPSRHLRAMAVRAMAKAANYSAFHTDLIGCLWDEEELVRKTAIEALAGAVNDPEVHSGLIKCLGDEDEDVRKAVTDVLANATNIPKVRSALIQTLQLDDEAMKQRFGDRYLSVKDGALNVLTGAVNIPEVSTALFEWYIEPWNLIFRDGEQAAEHALSQLVGSNSLLQSLNLISSDYTLEFYESSPPSKIPSTFTLLTAKNFTRIIENTYHLSEDTSAHSLNNYPHIRSIRHSTKGKSQAFDYIANFQHHVKDDNPALYSGDPAHNAPHCHECRHLCAFGLCLGY